MKSISCAGHNNVFYVGDRVKKADQLNGKSANLNHVLLQKIYPNVRKAEEVPLKDIFMVMDCDHMVCALFHLHNDAMLLICIEPSVGGRACAVTQHASAGEA